MPTKSQSKSPFVRGLCWGMIFSFTAIVSATVGASLVFHCHLLRQIVHSLKPDRAREENTTLTADNSWRSYFKSTLNRPVNILVMGIDPVLGGKEEKEVFSDPSDTLLLLRFAIELGKIGANGKIGLI